MAEPVPPEEKTLAVAERVSEILQESGVENALIGAAALAIHGYPRATEDVDLATDTDPFTRLREIRSELERKGYSVEFNEPDAEDPLGGVLTISGSDFAPVQIVNFHNPLNRQKNPGAEAIRSALSGAIAGSSLRVVDLPHLVALKLYSGGAKSRLDVIELLERNTGAVREIRRVCKAYELEDALNKILAEL